MSEEKRVQTEHGNISYWKTDGAADKPVVIFLHGLSSNRRIWRAMEELARSSGHGTLTLDLRGHGLSDKSRLRRLYRIPVLRKDLEHVIEAEGLKRFVLVGYSYGAYVALNYLRTFPDRACGAVLISANHLSPLAYRGFGFLSPVARLIVNLLGWLLVWQKRSSYPYFDPDKAMSYWKSTFAGYASMPLSVNFWMLSEVLSLDEREGLEHVMAPVLLLRGARDPFVTQREMEDLARRLPRARVATLGSGHYLATEYQELCTREMLPFLTTLS